MDEGGSRNEASLSEESECKGPLGRVPSTETPKDILSKALAWASVAIGAPLLVNMGGMLFS